MFWILLCLSLFSDAWAAWARGGSATGTRRTTYAFQAKMNQSWICLKWVILPPVYQPHSSPEEFMISVCYTSKPPTQTRLSRKTKKKKKSFILIIWVQTGLSNSTHAVIHCGVIMSVSQLQCAEMLKPAKKTQEVLLLQTHNRIMWHFKAPLTLSRV